MDKWLYDTKERSWACVNNDGLILIKMSENCEHCLIIQDDIYGRHLSTSYIAIKDLLRQYFSLRCAI